MKLPLAFLLLTGGAVFALGDGNSDFPQTQGQSAQGYGAGSDFTSTAGSGFTNTYQQPNQDGSAASRSSGGNAIIQGGGTQGGGGGGDAQMRGGSAQGGGRKGASGQQAGSPSGGSQQSGGGQNSDGKKESSDKPDGLDESGRAGMGPNGSRDEENDSGDEARGAAMNLEGARSNFTAVVEAYVAKKSAKGYWTYVPKKGGKPWHLVRPSVDEGSVRLKGGQRYAALVTLEDARGRKTLPLAFDVDFSGAKWKVIAVKPEAGSVSSRR